MGRSLMTTDAGVSLAIDAGQTGTKLRVEGEGGAPRDIVLPGVRTHEPLLPQLAEAVRAVARGLRAPIAVVSTGTTGLTAQDADAGALLRLLGDLAPARVFLAHDSVTSFLGTLGDRRGAVVAAGTGVVTLAVGAERVARVDGWGNIMGDAGSAYWIGREALDAAMRGYDGRGAETALTEVVRERWPDLEHAYIDLQNDPDRISVVAAYAKPVSDLAASDAVARRICLAAASELAHSVATALVRVSSPADAPLVSAVGGVFRSPLIRSRFEELLAERAPRARLERPHGTGLDGAATLPLLAPEHPLRSLISVAGTP